MIAPSAAEPAIAAALPGADGDPLFAVAAAHEGRRIVLHVDGEIDLATGPLLAEHLCRAEQELPASLVLDLGAVTFMDSTGVSVMLRALERARAGGWEFSLRHPPAQVQRLLGVVGLAGIVPVAA